MPTPSPRRTRYVLTAIGALGLIGAGSATIVAGAGTGDREIRLAATNPAATTAGTAAPDETTEAAAPSTQPTTSAPATPAASATPSASRPATVRPKSSQTTATTSRRTATAKPTTTTKAPSSGSTGSATVNAEVLRLVNAEREKAGCSGLSRESHLEAAAQKHSDRQAAQNTMSHQLPGEASMGDRVTAEGYQWRGVAENVAAGYTTAAGVMDGWMNSPGHKANILNCDYTEIGVGLAKSSSGTLYWTQNFATPA
ncbi:CAP domain-containing protein [Actinoplanes campanulatus]|uniref:CAP domain-containing protein n=1 Tax=Actinoplanes campanulatus TaxID=113559 RepID=UPI001953B304|nr:CAP domain-containing protein [Actinoplanes capillaceus]